MAAHAILFRIKGGTHFLGSDAGTIISGEIRGHAADHSPVVDPGAFAKLVRK
jgi:hypothetical protein